MKKIIWLTSWYPSREDAYTGDFIERHAVAASRFDDIHVLHVVKSKKNIFPENRMKEHSALSGGGRATIIYYKTPGFAWSWLEKLYSNYCYLKIHADFIKKYIIENGLPDGIHVHVGMKAGMAALRAKRKYGIPYLVSEHWSGLCPEAKPNFYMRSLFFRIISKQVMRNARACSAVSQHLANGMEDIFSLKQKVRVIPNVVNTDIFRSSSVEVKKIQFIHISSLYYEKNAAQILQAAAILKKKLHSFTLLIIGEPDEQLLNLWHSLTLEDVVSFMDFRPQRELVKPIQESIALILYSRFETFGCVVVEANACGKPAIVSDIPVFHETVRSGVNGVFVPLNNPAALAEMMYAIAMKEVVFDTVLMEKRAAELYAYDKIGTRFSEFYGDQLG